MFLGDLPPDGELQQTVLIVTLLLNRSVHEGADWSETFRARVVLALLNRLERASGQ
jgi:hypothetical protein